MFQVQNLCDWILPNSAYSVLRLYAAEVEAVPNGASLQYSSVAEMTSTSVRVSWGA